MKKIQKDDPFANVVLDKQEQSLEAAFERGEYENDPHFEEIKKMLAEAAMKKISNPLYFTHV